MGRSEVIRFVDARLNRHTLFGRHISLPGLSPALTLTAGTTNFVVNDECASSESVYLPEVKSRFTNVNQEGTLFIISLPSLTSGAFW